MANAIQRVFISFLNDDDKKQETYCELIEESLQYVKIKIGMNILTIPYHRILKVKKTEVGNGY
jgi:uncharacterized protein (UPF0248 family)